MVGGLGRYIHTYAWTYTYDQISILEGRGYQDNWVNSGLFCIAMLLRGLWLFSFSSLGLFLSSYFFMRQRLYTDTRAV